MTLLSLISHFSDKDGKNVLFRLHLSPLKDPKMSKKPIAPYPKKFFWGYCQALLSLSHSLSICLSQLSISFFIS